MPPIDVGQLHRRDDDRALADGNRNRFARIPFLVVHALLPFFRRHQPGFFAGQVDAGLAAEAQARGVLVDAVDSQALPDVVEEHVAGLHDGFVQVTSAMPAVLASSGRCVRKIRRSPGQNAV